MMNVLEEELLTLAQAANSLPNRPAVSTLWRWSSRGVKGVKLQTIAVGGRRYTTPKFLSEFAARLSVPGAAKESIGSLQRSPHEIQEDVRAKALFD